MKAFFNYCNERERQAVRVQGSAARENLIKKALDSGTSIEDSVNSAQQELGLADLELLPVLLFFDAIGVNRVNVHRVLYHCISEEVMQIVSTMSSSKLTNLLKFCLKYIFVRDLRNIPLQIMKNMPVIPNDILKLLTEKFNSGSQSSDSNKFRFFDIFPIKVRQQVWADKDSPFLQYIDDMFNNHASIDDRLVNSVVDELGHFEDLFERFADHCVKKDFENHEYKWGLLLQDVVNKAKTLNQGKLSEMAEIIDALSRKTVVESAYLRSIHDNLVVLITVQQKKNEQQYTDLLRSLGFSIEEKVVPIHEKGSSKVQHSNQKRKSSALKVDKEIEEVVPKKLRSTIGTGHTLISLYEKTVGIMKKLDRFKIFENPVTDEIVAGYSSVIKEPMDLSTISSKISSYCSIDELLFDIDLMLDNCCLFNGHLSQFGKYAEDLRKKFRARFLDDIIPLLASLGVLVETEKLWGISNGSSTSSLSSSSNPLSISISVPSSSKSIVLKLPSNSSDSACNSGFSSGSSSFKRDVAIPDPPKIKSESFSVEQNLEELMNLEIPSSLALDRLFDKLWHVLVKLDVDGIFATPVGDKFGYLSQIKEPVDISFIRVKLDRRMYKDLSAFDQDVKLMIKNCLIFNPIGDFHEIGKEFDRDWNAVILLAKYVWKVYTIKSQMNKPVLPVASSQTNNIADLKDSSFKKTNAKESTEDFTIKIKVDNPVSTQTIPALKEEKDNTVNSDDLFGDDSSSDADDEKDAKIIDETLPKDVKPVVNEVNKDTSTTEGSMDCDDDLFGDNDESSDSDSDFEDSTTATTTTATTTVTTSNNNNNDGNNNNNNNGEDSLSPTSTATKGPSFTISSAPLLSKPEEVPSIDSKVSTASAPLSDQMLPTLEVKVKPKPSEILVSSTEAMKVLNSASSQSKIENATFCGLPSVMAEKQLHWVLHMLRNPRFQSLLFDRIVSILIDSLESYRSSTRAVPSSSLLGTNAVATATATATATTITSSSSSLLGRSSMNEGNLATKKTLVLSSSRVIGPFLPYKSKDLCIALQLCQLAWTIDPILPAIDVSLLRMKFPLLLKCLAVRVNFPDDSHRNSSHTEDSADFVGEVMEECRKHSLVFSCSNTEEFFERIAKEVYQKYRTKK